MLQFGHVPGADDDAARVRVGFQRFDDVADLVDVPAVWCGPAAPLHAVHRAQVAVLACHSSPDGHAALFQPVVVAGAGQEHSSSWMMERCTFLVVTSGNLPSGQTASGDRNALGAGARAVRLVHAVREHMAHEVFVLGRTGRAGQAEAAGAAEGWVMGWITQGGAPPSGVACRRQIYAEPGQCGLEASSSSRPSATPVTMRPLRLPVDWLRRLAHPAHRPQAGTRMPSPPDSSEAEITKPG